MPTPSVGRVVHYQSYGTPGGEYQSVCRAAIITAVDVYQYSGDKPLDGDGNFLGAVGLCVMNPDGLFLKQGLLQDEDTKRGGTWHWPERVQD